MGHIQLMLLGINWWFVACGAYARVSQSVQVLGARHVAAVEVAGASLLAGSLGQTGKKGQKRTFASSQEKHLALAREPLLIKAQSEPFGSTNADSLSDLRLM